MLGGLRRSALTIRRMDRFDEDPPFAPRNLLDRLRARLREQPVRPVRLRTADGSVWEVWSRDSVIELAGRSLISILARGLGRAAWVDLDIRASQLVSVEIDSDLLGDEGIASMPSRSGDDA